MLQVFHEQRNENKDMEFIHSNRDTHGYLNLNASCTYHRNTCEIPVASRKSLVSGYGVEPINL